MIGMHAFENCNIKSITIPKSVKTIESSAFRKCKSLTSLTIASTDVEIDYHVFDESPIETATVTPAILKNLSLNYLKTLTVDGGEIIEERSLNYSGLETLIIGNSVKTIGNTNFYNCKKLKSIILGNNVTTIGENVFELCKSITDITVSAANTTYQSIDGVLYSKNGKTLIMYPPAKPNTGFIVPDTVTDISDYAFEYCSKLEKVTIPDSVTRIGDNAFIFSEKLETIIIGNNVTHIGLGAFHKTACYNNESKWKNGVLYIGNYLIKADNLSGSYTIQSGTVYITDYAFYNCNELTDITIPASVEIIGSNAFNRYLSSVYYRGTNEAWSSIKKDNNWIENKSYAITYNYTGE